MAGRGPAPSSQRRRANEPARGEWKATPGNGWQHGPVPPVPEGVHADTRAAWGVWMRSWFAAHWTPDDLPGLEHVASLHSEVRVAFHEPFIESENARGDRIYTRRPSPATELRQMMDSYGITPKGQQDRRWVKPGTEEPALDSRKAAPAPAADSPYGHLRVAK